MQEWILILTLIVRAGFADGGISAEIKTIPGFENSHICNAAGKMWENSIGNYSKSHVCVRVK